MRTMAMQWVFTAIALACALAAHGVARAVPRDEAGHRSAWKLVGWCLLLFGGNMAVMHAWGTRAMLGEPESPIMAGYLAWAPAFNHSRSALWLTCCGLLTAMAFSPRLARDRLEPAWVTVLVVGALIGAVLGGEEGRLVPSSHYTRVALGDTVELFAVMGTLLVTLVRSSVDRYLWALLTSFGAMVAINILWLAALSMVEDARVWSPSPFAMAMYRTVLMALMCGIAVQRLRLARRGAGGGSMIAEPRRSRPTLSG